MSNDPTPAAGGVSSSSSSPEQPRPGGARRLKKRPTSPKSRVFSVGGHRFRCSHTRLLDAFLDGCQTFMEYVVLLIGPMLILLALAIVSCLSYTFFNVLIPMMLEKHEDWSYKYHWIAVHCIWVMFLLVNILFNYFMCVTTRNTGPRFHKVVEEMADATDFQLPKTPEENEQWKKEYEDKMILRVRRRREREAEKEEAAASAKASADATTATKEVHSNGDDVENGHNGGATDPLRDNSKETAMTRRKTARSPTAPADRKSIAKKKPLSTSSVRRWMLMGPFEWGFCHSSNQAKPPRSHYDHVTKRLVLNLDHYCPWMFNSIGYFNYRYFVNFLIFVFMGMVYGALLGFEPFMAMQTDHFKEHTRLERQAKHALPRPLPMFPHRDEKLLISIGFMICAAIGFAILILGGFHVFLVLTAQTTIEFHGNWSKWRRQGSKFRNPYSEGYRKNWRRVYGDGHWFLSLLPSTREPQYLPFPIPGQDTRRASAKSGEKVRSPTKESAPGDAV